jgi:hypothetical protein
LSKCSNCAVLEQVLKQREVNVMDTGGPRYRLLLLGRALCLGILWGAVLGEVTWGVVIAANAIGEGVTVDDLLLTVLWSPLAGFVGGVVGGAVSLVAGLALALSGNGVLERVYRARLVTGSAAAAVPLAAGWHLSQWVSYSTVAGTVTAAAVAAVLVTPRILNGPPPPKNGAAPMPPVPRSGTALSKPGLRAPRRAAEHDERPEWQNTEPEPT